MSRPGGRTPSVRIGRLGPVAVLPVVTGALCAAAVVVLGAGLVSGAPGPAGAGAAALPGPALAPATVAVVASSDAAAVALVSRAVQAARDATWSGVAFMSAWRSAGTASALVDVSHAPGTTVSVTPHGAQGGASARAWVTGTGAPPDPTTVGALTHRYRLRLEAEPASVAGRPTRVVVATSAAGAVAARLWVDLQTGLVLRSELYDASGRTVRASAYVSFSTAAGPAPAATATSSAAAPWADDVGAAAAMTTLRRDAWTCPSTLPGGLSLVDARRTPAGAAVGTIVHLEYADGLSTLSLFEQRGRLDASSLPGFTRTRVGGVDVWARNGLTEQLTWVSGGTVFTLMSDAPSDVLDQVVAALPHDPPGGGVVDRLGRGMSRMASWLDPFG